MISAIFLNWQFIYNIFIEGGGGFPGPGRGDIPQTHPSATDIAAYRLNHPRGRSSENGLISVVLCLWELMLSPPSMSSYSKRHVQLQYKTRLFQYKSRPVRV